MWAANFPSPDYTKLQNQVPVTLKVETRWVTVRAARVRVAAPAQLRKMEISWQSSTTLNKQVDLIFSLKKK